MLPNSVSGLQFLNDVIGICTSEAFIDRVSGAGEMVGLILKQSRFGPGTLRSTVQHYQWIVAAHSAPNPPARHTTLGNYWADCYGYVLQCGGMGDWKKDRFCQWITHIGILHFTGYVGPASKKIPT